LLFFRCIARLWKIPHPSEDGEALQNSRPHIVQPPRTLVGDSFADQLQSPKWFALYALSRHEKRVAQHLTQREIEFFLPLYRSERKWRDGSRVTLELPLFPGYLFVRIRRTERGRVLSVPGALEVVGGTGGELATLPDATIDSLRDGLQLRGVEPHPLLTVGQRVRIRTGAFVGLEGVVVRNKKGLRVVLTLDHIMQSFSVEVAMEDLEPISTAKMAVPCFSAA
jgi:transcription antitermination factor NusG